MSAAGGTLVALFLLFAKTGAFIFGSGLAIVPFLREGSYTSTTGSPSASSSMRWRWA